MLLKNKDPKFGLCNGTRLLCHGFLSNMLDVEVPIGNHAGRRVFFYPKLNIRQLMVRDLPLCL